MQVYFAAALVQKSSYGAYYDRILDVLERDGHQVFKDVVDESYEMGDKSEKERTTLYKRSLQQIAKCDVAIFEISFPSTIRIGYEVSFALEKKKPVIAVYFQGKESAYFTGMRRDKMFLSDYRDFDLEEVIQDGMRYASQQTETRYNLYLSSSHIDHLEQMAAETKIPRSAYIRKLIENDIKRLNKKGE